MASFQVKIAKNFLLKILLIVSVSHKSSALSMAPIERVVSVFEEVFVAGVVLEGELSENVTRAFVGVDFAALVSGVLRRFGDCVDRVVI